MFDLVKSNTEHFKQVKQILDQNNVSLDIVYNLDIVNLPCKN